MYPARIAKALSRVASQNLACNAQRTNVHLSINA
jgi:hypothetical protein